MEKTYLSFGCACVIEEASAPNFTLGIWLSPSATLTRIYVSQKTVYTGGLHSMEFNNTDARVGCSCAKTSSEI